MITDPAIEFEWIAIEMSESLCGGKGSSFCDLKAFISFLALSISLFFDVGLMRTVANINLKVIHFDAVDFSGHHSKKLCFFWRSVYIIFWGEILSFNSGVIKTIWHSWGLEYGKELITNRNEIKDTAPLVPGPAWLFPSWPPGVWTSGPAPWIVYARPQASAPGFGSSSSGHQTPAEGLMSRDNYTINIMKTTQKYRIY